MVMKRNEVSLGSLLKSPLQKLNMIDQVDQANIVYNISCDSCLASYTGHSSRPYAVRSSEHAREQQQAQ